MGRFMAINVSVLVLVGLIVPGHADEPAKPAELKTYTVSCKLIRKLLFDNAQGKRELDTTTRNINLTTLEGTYAEYHSGSKVGATPYGFQLRTKVTTGEAKNKVRLEVQAEDSSTEGNGFNPVVQIHRQRAVRQIRLGKPIVLELDKNKQGEGVWIELTVLEASEE